MLCDFSVLLEFEEVEVFSVSLASDNTFGSTSIRASFKIKFVLEHLFVLELDGIFHKAEDDRRHSRSLDCEHAKDLRDEGVWVLAVV